MSCWSAHAVVVSNATAAAQTDPSAQRSDCATAKAFLLSQPNGGVYTCARATRDGRALVLWRFHLERLALDLRLTHEGAYEALVSTLQSTSTRLCKSVARSCAAAESRADVDLMVTTLWWRDADARFHVSAHACVMPAVRTIKARGRGAWLTVRLVFHGPLTRLRCGSCVERRSCSPRASRRRLCSYTEVVATMRAASTRTGSPHARQWKRTHAL